MSGRHHRHLTAPEKRTLDAQRRCGLRAMDIEGREEFLRDNAVSIVKELDRYIAALREQVRLLTNQRNAALARAAAEREACAKVVENHCNDGIAGADEAFCDHKTIAAAIRARA